jgi:hypothetical protein
VRYLYLIGTLQEQRAERSRHSEELQLLSRVTYCLVTHWPFSQAYSLWLQLDGRAQVSVNFGLLYPNRAADNVYCARPSCSGQPFFLQLADTTLLRLWLAPISSFFLA